jgi:hypothetical protein
MGFSRQAKDLIRKTATTLIADLRGSGKSDHLGYYFGRNATTRGALQFLQAFAVSAAIALSYP